MAIKIMRSIGLSVFVGLAINLAQVERAWPLSMGSAYEWTGMSGPGPKEHSLTWVEDQYFYIVGGYGFFPYQGISSKELWRLDLRTQTWKEIPTLGDGPSGSARAVFVENKGILLALSMDQAYFGQRKLALLHKLEIKNDIGYWTRVEYVATNQQQANSISEFMMRDHQLGSLIYNDRDQRFYTSCTRSDCQLFAIQLDGEIATVEKIEVSGEVPGGRLGHAYGYSKKDNKFVMSGGQNLENPTVLSFWNETWTLDFNQVIPKWEKQQSTIEGRRNPCFGFHQKNNELVVWGGTNDGRHSLPGIHSYSLNTRTFIARESELGAVERSSCVGAYDPNQEVLLLGFGNSLDTTNYELITFQDLWWVK